MNTYLCGRNLFEAPIKISGNDFPRKNALNIFPNIGRGFSCAIPRSEKYS